MAVSYTHLSRAAPQDCPLDVVKASGNYINAIDKGLLKIMSKMGISTSVSYTHLVTGTA